MAVQAQRETEQYQKSLNSLVFSPDGQTLSSGSHDGIRLWDVELKSWIKRARWIANRDLTPEERERYLGKEETFFEILHGWLVEHGILSR
jgi:WD40 repeat protein